MRTPTEKIGIRKAASRHIKEFEKLGKPITIESITKAITSSMGFRIVRWFTGVGIENVEQIVKGVIKNYKPNYNKLSFRECPLDEDDIEQGMKSE